MRSPRNPYIRRFTTLSSALDTLKNRKLVLLNPDTWDDKNDGYFMEIYKASVKAESIFALCCTMAPETYHHWKVFTNGMEGICIEINRIPFQQSIKDIPDVRFNAIEYTKVQDLEALDDGDLSSLPFRKRIGYKDEIEWRIIAQSNDPIQQYFNVPIEISFIKRIILNPWLPKNLSDNLREIIKSIPGCRRITVEASQLTNSERWKAAGRNLLQS